MKAIKIPNTALLDVFGRPVATNSQDFHRLSYAHHLEKNSGNNHYEPHSKSSNATASGIKLDNAHLLTVIGLSSSQKKRKFLLLNLF